MKKSIRDFIIRITVFFNILFMAIPYAYMWYEHYLPYMFGSSFYRRGNIVMIGLFCFIYFMYARVYEGFGISLNRISELIYSQVLSLGITDFILYVVTWMLFRFPPSPLPIGLAFVIQCFISLVWSLLAHKWYFFVSPPERTAVIYSKLRSLEDLVHQYGLEKKFQIDLTIEDDECIARDMKDLIGIETVLLCGVQSHQRNIILKHCIANGISMFMIPRIGDAIMTAARPVHMFHLPVMMTERYNPPIEYKVIKRAMDIVLPAIVLIVLSPIFLITMIAIKLEDGGSVFYKQKRLTINGRVFDVIKFRSMRVDAEKDGIPRLSSGDNDDRITKVGHFIRKVRIDELPQLINIIKGDMSIVGPRPERPEIAAEYEKDLPEFCLRLQVKAGLTGYAQVYGKYNTIPYDKLLMDLIYIARPGILEDIRIIFATIKILFIPDSTEGIDKDKTTAM